MSEQHRAGGFQQKTAIADEIFLSPRVVDRQAFNEFAGQLRELIQQAGAQAEGLRTAAAEAQRTRDGLRDAVNANQMKLEMATRALAAIDQKADQTRKMIESAGDLAGRAEELRTQADQIVTERLGVLCQRLNEAEESAVTQVETLHSRLNETLVRASEREAAISSSIAGAAQLADLVRRAEDAVDGAHGLGAVIERAETAGRTAASATSELDAVRRQAEQARKGLAEALNAAVPIIDDAGAIQGHLEATVSEAIRVAQTARDSMAEFVAARQRELEEGARGIEPLLERLDSQAASVLEELDAASRTAADARARAAEATRSLESLLTQMEPWKRVLLSDSEDEPVGAAISGMVVELKNEIRGVAGALRAIAERAEAALEPDPAPVAQATTRRRTRASVAGAREEAA
jgi:DNA repair exonuclease SbcCD ATPase subunit